MSLRTAMRSFDSTFTVDPAIGLSVILEWRPRMIAASSWVSRRQDVCAPSGPVAELDWPANLFADEVHEPTGNRSNMGSAG